MKHLSHKTCNCCRGNASRKKKKKHLQNPLRAFAPPHHQGGHEQRDQHRHGDERGEDADGRVVQEPAGPGAVVEVGAVEPREEAVDRPVGPEAVHPQRHLVGAVCESLVRPAGGDRERQKPSLKRPFIGGARGASGITGGLNAAKYNRTGIPPGWSPSHSLGKSTTRDGSEKWTPNPFQLTPWCRASCTTGLGPAPACRTRTWRGRGRESSARSARRCSRAPPGGLGLRGRKHIGEATNKGTVGVA